MLRINIHDAKTHLSRYLEQVEKGEVVTICRNNVPIAELRALPKPQRGKRRLGLHKGQIEITDAFFEPMSEDELDLWYGTGQ
jgi:antitoxin (DNA-binding transcriptional repressor) of toxin-antitoxin stability system